MAEGPHRLEDRLDPARAAMLWSLLKRDGPAPSYGDALPHLFHHIYFWPVPASDAATPASQDVFGSLASDLGLPRRMSAGASFVFHGPLRLGISAEKASVVRGVTKKEGRTGRLAFVTLRHEIRQRGALVLTEDQDWVFRQPYRADDPTPTPPMAQENPTISQTAAYDPWGLLRYSALTMSDNRIHCDEGYAASQGYNGLVVHAPLMALNLLHMAQGQLGDVATFQYRATSPLTQHDTARLCIHGGDLWVEREDRALVLTARAA